MVKAIKMKTMNLCWKELWSQCVRERRSISTETVDKIRKNIVELAIKIDGEGFLDININ